MPVLEKGKKRKEKESLLEQDYLRPSTRAISLTLLPSACRIDAVGGWGGLEDAGEIL